MVMKMLVLLFFVLLMDILMFVGLFLSWLLRVVRELLI